MAFFVSVHKDLNLVYTDYSGQLNRAQIAKALAATLEHPDYRPGMIELTDLTRLISVDMDFNHMLGHQSRMAAHYGGQQEITEHYVVAPTDLGFGMSRMYQTLAEEGVPNMNLHLFRSERDALQAMGRNETSIAELLGN